MTPTLGHDEVALGLARMWPPDVLVVHEGSMVDVEERHYLLVGEEFWDDNGNDSNGYGYTYTREIAERIVACWNAFHGVPTEQIAQVSPQLEVAEAERDALRADNVRLREALTRIGGGNGAANYKRAWEKAADDARVALGGEPQGGAPYA